MFHLIFCLMVFYSPSYFFINKVQTASFSFNYFYTKIWQRVVLFSFLDYSITILTIRNEYSHPNFSIIDDWADVVRS